jgi:hypothetical protein
MSVSNSTPKNRRKSAAVASKPRRASQRAATISIDIYERALRELMIEQCRDGESFITVYRGSRAEFMAAGVPEAAFALSEFPISGKYERELRGSMRATDIGFELEVYWGCKQPRDASHPVIAELARMLLIDASYWTDDFDLLGDRVDHALPIKRLIEDKRAEDYKPRAGAQRFQLTPEFHKALKDYARSLFCFVHAHGEVVPCIDKAPVAAPPRLRLVADNAVKS